MFGYIRPYDPELRVKELAFYQSIYCGLCHRLKKDFGFVSTFSLNYDFVFLALLKMSLTDTTQAVSKKKCVINPTKKKSVLVDESLYFASQVLVLSSYYKLADHRSDKGFKEKTLAFAATPFGKKYHRIVSKEFIEIDVALATLMREQSLIEEDKSDNLDLASDPTGKSLGVIFSFLSTDEKQKKILQRMGYFLGRWVYLIDAIDDMEDDFKKKNYNPFLLKYKITLWDQTILPEIWNDIEETLNMTIGEIVNCYHLLEIKQYKDILDNLIFLGFTNTQKSIKNKRSFINE